MHYLIAGTSGVASVPQGHPSVYTYRAYTPKYDEICIRHTWYDPNLSKSPLKSMNPWIHPLVQGQL